MIGLDRNDAAFADWNDPKLDLRIVDITDANQVQALALDRVDIPVNNAGSWTTSRRPGSR